MRGGGGAIAGLCEDLRWGISGKRSAELKAHKVFHTGNRRLHLFSRGKPENGGGWVYRYRYRNGGSWV